MPLQACEGEKPKVIRTTFILLFIGLNAFGQNTLPSLWTPELINRANTAKDLKYLSEEEKAVVFYTNLVRLDPPLFEKTYLKEYLNNNDISSSKWTKSLIKTLRRTQPMPELLPRNDLYEEAKKHALDMGKSGKIGHKTSKGKASIFDSNISIKNTARYLKIATMDTPQAWIL